MGNTNSINKINFEDVQFLINNQEKYIIINTLNENEQDCILPYTITPEKETSVINSLMRNSSKDIKIIIYGKNCNDDKIYKKYNQLLNLGFYNSYIYTGGLFEWLLLQDIYGSKEFPTTKKELDILKFKPKKKLNIPLLEY
jgi:uncharacterized membrane protein